VFYFLAASARAKLIPSPILFPYSSTVAVPRPGYDIRSRPILLKLRRHEFHIRIDMAKKILISLTQVIQPFLQGKTSEGISGIPDFRKSPIVSGYFYYVNLE
jgi:hypothetical protein